MNEHDVLRCAQAHAIRYLDSLPHRPVGATLDAVELRRRLGGPLPQNATDAVQVIDHLVRDVDGGLHSSTGGRFFGWVIGGVVPAALAADWLTATWDQNAATPGAGTVGERLLAWCAEPGIADSSDRKRCERVFSAIENMR